MAKVRFFCPISFECPKGFHKETEFFGMGPKNAIALSKKLHRLEADYFVVFGTAGALDEEKTAGEVFLISALHEHQNYVALPIPPSLEELARASLTSVSEIAYRPEAKEALYQSHQAELVDMESIQLWTHLHPEIQNKTILIRGVIDEKQNSLTFLEKPKNALSIQGAKEGWTLLRNYRRYRKNMAAFLNHLKAKLDAT